MTIYITGTTPTGTPLIGGVWTMWEQEGFPLESSLVLCAANGWAIDFLEAMADASTTDNLPALMKHLEVFLPANVLTAIKAGYAAMLASGTTCHAILEQKRQQTATS